VARPRAALIEPAEEMPVSEDGADPSTARHGRG
jgi:hypothetical protein